ncbi:MAG: helix-turn-helix transcriptional regulator [Eubacterium sp.]|nr:helix-turn-helix transcriptional regulator [Eubacterium sp.]
MNVRIKEIRKKENLSQQKFADRLGIARGNIAAYEVGKNAPSDAVLSLICREFNINEEWLRTGQGDMYDIPLDDTAIAASNILENENVPFYDSIKRIIQIYEKLDPDAQDIINKEIEDFLENAKK